MTYHGNSSTVIKLHGWRETHYCVYCSQAVKEDVSYDEYEKHVAYRCDCVEALEEIKAKDTLEDLKSKQDKQLIRNIEYENEIERVNRKYKRSSYV